MRILNTIERNLRNLSKSEAVSNDEIRTFVINQYRRLKLAGFSEEEIANCVTLNDKEREAMNKEFNLLDSTKADIAKSIADLYIDELDNDTTDNNTEEEIVEVEEVKEEKDNKVVLTKEEKEKAEDILPVSDEEEKAEAKDNSSDNEKEEVKNESEEKEEVKNESEEKEEAKAEEISSDNNEKEEVKDLTDEEIIDKAIKEQLEVISSEEEKAKMEKILRKSFKENKELVEIYRNKYNATSKFNNTVEKISNSNDNKESEDEGDYVYLNIAPEELEDLVNDIKNDYDNDYGVKTNKKELRSIIIDILDKNENLLKSTTYGELYSRTKDILDDIIDSSTVEIGNDNQDELLKDLNSIFGID